MASRVAKKRSRSRKSAKRATRGPVRVTKTVYLRLPESMVREIQSLARSRGWTVNRWFETLLEASLYVDGRDTRK